MPNTQDINYYITTPIYYVNGMPHIGAATTTTVCDVLARYHRLRGRKTRLLTGTDENALKVQEAAQKAGVPVTEFVEGLATIFRDCWQQMHIGFDDFYRTTEARHTRAVQEFVTRLQERDYVYKDTYVGWYSISDETFFRDSEVKDGIAIETGKPVTRVEEDNYFFRLSAFGDRLRAYIDVKPDFLLPEFRRNEVIAFIEGGLRDISITRTNRGWGIPLPGDEGRVVYVWIDALINYLAATGWPDAPNWDAIWPADVHMVGKEIFVRFHATLWPALLMALDLPLPKQIFAHGFWTIHGEKGGKTGASLPHPLRFIALIAARSGTSFDLAADALRYLLCREMNFGQDTEFSVASFLRRFNADLANDLGNLLNRTINMVNKYLQGIVPIVLQHDPEISALALQVQEEYEQAMNDFRPDAALEATWKLVGRMNKYIDEHAPWRLMKSAAAGDKSSQIEMETVLYSCLEAIRIVSLLIAPYMPIAADAIRRQLGLTETADVAHWEDTAWGGLPVGERVGLPKPIFPRIMDLTVDELTLHALGSATSDPMV